MSANLAFFVLAAFLEIAGCFAFWAWLRRGATPLVAFLGIASLIGFVRSWAQFISDFDAGETATVFPGPGAPFGAVICYEVIFPELFRQFVAGGAGFMVNITNDAWFGRTNGPWQHLGTLPLRAVEHRVAIARSANTGVSGFVSPSGRVTQALPLFERGVLVDTVPVRRAPTVYTRFGDWLAYACVAAAAGLGLWAARRKAQPAC